ncbi:hypothetical protein ACFQ7I_08420 [Streptomyces massasporeus]
MSRAIIRDTSSTDRDNPRGAERVDPRLRVVGRLLQGDDEVDDLLQRPVGHGGVHQVADGVAVGRAGGRAGAGPELHRVVVEGPDDERPRARRPASSGPGPDDGTEPSGTSPSGTTSSGVALATWAAGPADGSASSGPVMVVT